MTPAIESAANGCRHNSQLQQQPRPACKCQRLHWPRRMHALGGLLMGCFLIAHLAVGVTGLSPQAWQRNTRILVELPIILTIAIWLPLLGQIVSGLWLLRKEGIKYRVKKCSRGGKLRFFLQRVTGLAILAFALFHIGTLHPWGLHAAYQATHISALGRYADAGLFQADGAAFRSTVEGFSRFCGTAAAGNWIVAALCLLGIWSAVFHTANGAWSGAIVWNLAATPTSKRRWGHVCAAIGIVLFALGTVAWYAFTLSDAALRSY